MFWKNGSYYFCIGYIGVLGIIIDCYNVPGSFKVVVSIVRHDFTKLFVNNISVNTTLTHKKTTQEAWFWV